MSAAFTAFKFGFATRDDFALALAFFYGMLVIVLSFLIVIEAHLGMFTGLSSAEALLRTTGMDLIPNELAGF